MRRSNDIQKKTAGVKENVKISEEISTTNSETKASFGAISKNKTSSANEQKCERKQRPLPLWKRINSGVDSDEDKDVYSDKKEYLIEKLINTEEKYITNLDTIVKHYILYYCESKLTQNLTEKQHNIFNNITDIYNKSKHFLAALKSCGYDHEKIAEAFIEFEFMFQLYPVYCMNKANADSYLVEFQTYASCKQKELGDELDLTSCLLAPIQHLRKYKLFLKEIDGQLKKTNSHSIKVERALNMVKEVMSKADDYVAIGSITHSKIDLSKAGQLLMKAKFYMRTNEIEQYFQSMVFFFEQVIVFTIENNKEEDVFKYFESIQMTNLLLPPLHRNEPLTLELEDYSKRELSKNKHCIYTLIASTISMNELWRKMLEEQLWKQADKFKDEINTQRRDEYTLMRKLQNVRIIESRKCENVAFQQKRT